MQQKIPRLILAGTHSGCGKTTVTCAILRALVKRKKNVSAFKCGPDYIDPMFHRQVIGVESANLDLFFFSENTLRYLLMKGGEGRDISIIEGVMGYYDGQDVTSQYASTYQTAQVTGTPVVLVVDAKGASLSLMAVIRGFLDFYTDSHICGVILNRCPPHVYPRLAEELRNRFKGRVRAFGYLPPMPDISLESRYLGLVTADEVEGLHHKLQILAAQAEKTIDLDGLFEVGEAAPALECNEVGFKRWEETVRIAVARDRAFCFYYEESLSVLEEMGAELVPFSPLNDKELPPDIHGLYLGGGYPELVAAELSHNLTMRQSIRSALDSGLPCIAECGGFMYLTHDIAGFPMVGFLPGSSFDTGKLSRFGYILLKAQEDNILCAGGEEIPAHEFHYWDSDETGNSFCAVKPSGRHWDCVFASPRLYAGYPHFHFYANLSFAERFYKTCLEEKHGRIYEA